MSGSSGTSGILSLRGSRRQDRFAVVEVEVHVHVHVHVHVQEGDHDHDRLERALDSDPPRAREEPKAVAAALPASRGRPPGTTPKPGSCATEMRMIIDRRRFLGALALAPAAVAGCAASRAERPAADADGMPLPPTRSDADATRRSLAAIRAFPVPADADPAFVFRAAAARPGDPR